MSMSPGGVSPRAWRPLRDLKQAHVAALFAWWHELEDRTMQGARYAAKASGGRSA